MAEIESAWGRRPDYRIDVVPHVIPGPCRFRLPSMRRHQSANGSCTPTPAIYAGAGLAQGDGRVFSHDGRLMASYTVQAMIHSFTRDPSSMGMDHTNAM